MAHACNHFFGRFRGSRGKIPTTFTSGDDFLRLLDDLEGVVRGDGEADALRQLQGVDADGLPVLARG